MLTGRSRIGCFQADILFWYDVVLPGQALEMKGYSGGDSKINLREAQQGITVINGFSNRTNTGMGVERT